MCHWGSSTRPSRTFLATSESCAKGLPWNNLPGPEGEPLPIDGDGHHSVLVWVLSILLARCIGYPEKQKATPNANNKHQWAEISDQCAAEGRSRRRRRIRRGRIVGLIRRIGRRLSALGDDCKHDDQANDDECPKEDRPQSPPAPGLDGHALPA